MPRNWSTSEGKRHITTVNVKLRHALNDEHRQHEDTKFEKSTYDSLMEISSFLEPCDVAVLSQDDKAKVPLGLHSFLNSEQYQVFLQWIRINLKCLGNRTIKQYVTN